MCLFKVALAEAAGTVGTPAFFMAALPIAPLTPSLPFPWWEVGTWESEGAQARLGKLLPRLGGRSGHKQEGTDCVSNTHPLSCVPAGEKLNSGGGRGQGALPKQSEEIFLRFPAEIYF